MDLLNIANISPFKNLSIFDFLDSISGYHIQDKFPFLLYLRRLIFAIIVNSFWHISCVLPLGNNYEIPNLWETKIEKTHAKEKQSHIKQYLRSSAICLRPRSCRDFTIIREKYKVWQYSFSLSQKLQRQNPNHQSYVFYIMCTRFTMDYKTGQIFFQGTPKRLVHEHYSLGLSTQAFTIWTKPEKISH